MLGKRLPSVSPRSPDRFTPRQVIGLILAVAFLLITLPVTAKAAGSLVTLADSSTSHKARVDGQGRLGVLNQPVGATSTWVFHYESGAVLPLFIPPAGKTTFAITSIVASNSTASPGSLVLSEYANTDCFSSPQGDVLVVNTPAQDTVSLPFPTPLLVAPGGSNWCLTFDQNSGDRFTLVGYYY